MMRTVLALLAVVAVAVLMIALRGEPGAAELTWLGWNVRTTAAFAALALVFFTLATALLWRGLIWIAEQPRRAVRARAEVRRRQGADALTRGFLAAAAGDGLEARRQAQRAAALADDTPALVRLLSVQAAEAAGDGAAARAAYAAMMGFPELRLAAHRGLMQIALTEGDAGAAERHAADAYALARTALWAWRSVLEARLTAGDWQAALELVAGAVERKIISPLTGERARAALLVASAAGREDDPDPKARQAALESASTAARLRPGFAPAAVIAARLLAAEGRLSRAAQVIETAWKAQPHPTLWLAYRDLRSDETPRERAGRLASLAAFNPADRESRVLAAEQTLLAHDLTGARAAARDLDSEPLTRRLAGLRARIAGALGERDEARAWVVRGREAPQEPDWSDLDPDGRAFAYDAGDWARIVRAYAERGELAHPRFDRGDRGVSDLPELPAAYIESAPYVGAAETGLPPIVDDGAFVEEPAPPAVSAETAPRPRRPFRAKART